MPKAHRPWKMSELAQLRALRKSGASLPEIAKILDRSYNAVAIQVSFYGIPRTTKDGYSVGWKGHASKAIEMYQNGVPLLEIAKVSDKDLRSVRAFLKRKGVWNYDTSD
jgi:hypothetical protein